MKFSVCLATGYEGLAYPVNFCEPQDLVRMGSCASSSAMIPSGATTTSPPRTMCASMSPSRRTSTTC